MSGSRSQRWLQAFGARLDGNGRGRGLEIRNSECLPGETRRKTIQEKLETLPRHCR